MGRSPRAPSVCVSPNAARSRCSAKIAFNAIPLRACFAFSTSPLSRRFGSAFLENSYALARPHLFPLMRRLPFPKSATARAHAFAHPGHRVANRATVRVSNSRRGSNVLRGSSAARPPTACSRPAACSPFARVSVRVPARQLAANPRSSRSPPVASPARSHAMSAAPIAPIRCAESGRVTSAPHVFSKARSTASDLNAPPCTTILFPKDPIRSAPMMRKSAFFTTE